MTDVQSSQLLEGAHTPPTHTYTYCAGDMVLGTYVINLKNSGESSLDLGSTLSGNLARARQSKNRKLVWSSRSRQLVLNANCCW